MELNTFQQIVADFLRIHQVYEKFNSSKLPLYVIKKEQLPSNSKLEPIVKNFENLNKLGQELFYHIIDGICFLWINDAQVRKMFESKEQALISLGIPQALLKAPGVSERLASEENNSDTFYHLKKFLKGQNLKTRQMMELYLKQSEQVAGYVFSSNIAEIDLALVLLLSGLTEPEAEQTIHRVQAKVKGFIKSYKESLGFVLPHILKRKVQAFEKAAWVACIKEEVGLNEKALEALDTLNIDIDEKASELLKTFAYTN